MTVKVSLGEICEFVGGGTPSRKIQRYWSGSIPWATVKDFRSNQISATEEFISQEGLDNSASKVVPSGTVLLVTRVGLGKVAMAGIDLAINQDVKAVVPSNNILPEFLFWSLRHLGPQIERKGTGATVKGVTLQDVKGLEISVPPLGEQRRIVGILNRAAKIERLRAQAQERLREFIPALFIKMFGDPVENPMGWKIERLGDLIQGFQGGKNLKAGGSTSKFRILKVSAVTGGVFDPSMSKPAPEGYVAPSDHLVRVGDLLISRANTTALVGATAMVEHDVPRVLLPDKLWRFVWHKNSEIDPTYLHTFLQASSTRHALSALATGTSGSMKNISQAKLKTLPVLLPPSDIQYRFAKIVKSVASASTLSKSSSTIGSTLSTSLMSRFLEAGT